MKERLGAMQELYSQKHSDSKPCIRCDDLTRCRKAYQTSDFMDIAEPIEISIPVCDTCFEKVRGTEINAFVNPWGRSTSFGD